MSTILAALAVLAALVAGIWDALTGDPIDRL